MRDNGYRTACIGKWHLGSWKEYAPNSRGFDYFWGFLGGCIDSYSHFYYWGGPNRHDLWRNGEEIHEEGKFFAAETLREAEEFILRDGDDRPFFLYWAVNIPHYPLQPAKKWLDHYADLPAPRRMYAAFVSTFDDYLGRLRAFLRERGLEENTLVILQSDNGHSTEVRTFGGGGYCGDYRGGKFSLFEGGIRVPAIVSWPGHLPQGETRDQTAMNIDWFPTILELCGLDASGIDVDGGASYRCFGTPRRSLRTTCCTSISNGSGPCGRATGNCSAMRSTYGRTTGTKRSKGCISPTSESTPRSRRTCSANTPKRRRSC